MKRRDFLNTMGLGAAALALPPGLIADGASTARPLRRAQDRPNIVFIIIDDLGWKDVGFMGSRYYETPNIDKLAGQGVVFTNAYANAPNCAPTRACLLTGQYSPRHGVYTVASPARGEEHLRKLIPIPNKTTLVPRVVTIAEALKPAGYVSASVGKWHLGRGSETGPSGQGFDVNVGGNDRGHPRSYFSPYQIEELKDGPEGEYLTDRLTTEALGFIKTNKDNPFFLYLSHYAVHTPIQAKWDITEKYKEKKGSSGQGNPAYAAMIESTDQSVGRVIDNLDELGLMDRTVVFFFSDNGGYGPVTSMEPLRGAKGMLYEGGIRVPLIVRWPGKVRPGGVCDMPVIGIDFYPTILEMTGATKPSGHILDGESLVPLLTQSAALRREAIFWHFPAYLEAYRGGKSQSPWRTTPVGAVRQGDWKLIEFFEDGNLELYNLKEDVGERNNLAEKMPELAGRLHRELLEWRRSVNAPVPTERNPRYDPNARPVKG